MNYILERERFVRIARDDHYSGNEQLLWNALFTIFNERAGRNGGEWPDGFIRITNKELLSWLPFTENTLNPARAMLVNREKHSPVLVEYIKGRKNDAAPQYKMNYVSVNDYRKICGNNGGNSEGNNDGNPHGNDYGNAGDIKEDVNQTIPVENNHTHFETASTVPRAREGATPGKSYLGLDEQYHAARYDAAYLVSEKARKAVAQRLLNGFLAAGAIVNTSDCFAFLCKMLEDGLPPELVEDCAKTEECKSTGALEGAVRRLWLSRGYSAAEEKRERARLLLVANGNQELFQALWRMRSAQTKE